MDNGWILPFMLGVSMKFALITADPSHKVAFVSNPERGDATSFMQWVSILKGVHLSFEALRKESNDYLKGFDVVMMSGHLNYIADIIRIGNFLKDSNAITIFYPEGSAQLYDNSINGFHPEYYEAWRACDVVSIAEEDKCSYYQSFVDFKKTLIHFIHVPITEDMEKGAFFRLRGMKRNFSVVYGDNNPNHPMIAFSCINWFNNMFNSMAAGDNRGLELEAVGIETRNADIKRIFPDLKIQQIPKLESYDFMRLLAESVVHFYPTEWIGTARQPIACAAAGTPCIGSDKSHTQRRLWPELACDIYDVDKMACLASRLVTNPGLYSEVVNHALKEMEYYSLKKTLERFDDAIRLARRNFKQEEVQA